MCVIAQKNSLHTTATINNNNTTNNNHLNMEWMESNVAEQIPIW